MTPVELLKSLSGPAALSGAPFGADLIAMCTALEARGGAGVSAPRPAGAAAPPPARAHGGSGETTPRNLRPRAREAR